MQHPHFEKDAIIPAFILPGTDGMPHSPWDYKQRENLLLVITRSVTTHESRELLRFFAQHTSALREEMCAILALSPDTVITNLEAQENLHLPFPLLADPIGKVISYYVSYDTVHRTLTPSMILTNRYNAFYQQWTLEREGEAAPIVEIIDALHYLNNLCVP